jgi:hypothetical protein
MKITKARLKKIIREEKARLLSESMRAHHDLHESYATPGFEGSLMDQVDHGILEMKLNTLFQHFENAGYTREDIVYAIKGIIE